MRRLLAIFIALGVLGTVMSAGLLLITPSVTHFASARARQAHVLGRLVATGALTRAQADRAYRQPLHLRHGRRAGCRPG